MKRLVAMLLSPFVLLASSPAGAHGPDAMRPFAGWGYGMGWLWFFIMAAFWIVVIAGIVFFIRWLVSSGRPHPTRSEDPALEILKKRYARGEISKEEFGEKKKDLEK
jgi:putative membrane protein